MPKIICSVQGVYPEALLEGNKARASWYQHEVKASTFSKGLYCNKGFHQKMLKTKRTCEFFSKHDICNSNW